MSSGSGSGRSPPGGSSPTPSTSKTTAALAGAAASSHRRRRDRTRSRSPRLATPSGGDVTTSDSIATPLNSTARDAVAQTAAARDTTGRDATPRAGTSSDGTPQDAESNLNFRHILIKHKHSRRPIDNDNKPVTRSKDEAMDLVIDIHEKITRDLITFADAAVSFSDCTSARHEGDIQSRFKRGRMQKSFENAALALTPGKISEIIETNSGYHIIQRAAVAGAAADSHRRDRTRSRSPRLATPSDGDATTSDSIATTRHSTPRDTVPRDAVPRDAMPRDAVPRDAVPHDAAVRDAAARDAAPRDAAARETTGRDAIPCDGTSGTSGNGTPQDGPSQDEKSNFKFSHILIKHKHSRRPIDNDNKPVTRNKNQAMDLVIDIHEKLTKGLITFGDAAVTFSDCASARHEGDIQSQFRSGRAQKSFEAAALALNPGQISHIIESKSGYHILKRRE